MDALVASGGLEITGADITLGDMPSCDATLMRSDELLEFVRDIECMRPFGHEFERPVVDLVLSLAACRIEPLGRDASHIRITTPTGLRILWWNAAERLDHLRELGDDADPYVTVVHLRGALSLNRFRDSVSAQFIVDAMLDDDGMAI